MTQQLAEHLFRHEYGNILAALVNRFGHRHFGLLEESVQSAFQRALERWPFSGIPDNPAGWLYTVARNATLEALRRAGMAEVKLQHLADTHEFPPVPTPADEMDPARHLDELATMVLLCCNADLSPAAQICLTLKAACGFSVREIARALAMNEEAVKKTISRAKHRVAEDAMVLGDLDAMRIAQRFSAVTETCYALFNEGYAASTGDFQLRRDVAEEAIRLGDVLLSSTLTPLDRKADLHALMALMLLQLARFDARAGEDGHPVRLQEQDRTKWDAGLIRAGLGALEASLSAPAPTSYHLEARIAAEHSTSATFEATNWSGILTLYDQLLQLKDTARVRLNRVVALRYARGALAAFDEFGQLTPEDTFVFHAVRADLLEACGRPAEASAAWATAASLAPTKADRAFAQRKTAAGG